MTDIMPVAVKKITRRRNTSRAVQFDSVQIGDPITGDNHTQELQPTRHEKAFNPDTDCWTSGFPSVVDQKYIETRSADAKYLSTMPSFISSRMNTPSAQLRAKTVNDFNKFMMNHPWRKRGVDDMEDENKEAYDKAYDDNPQHVADKVAFQEAEARIANKNSILRAVMVDPGMGVLDYNVEEPDQVALLQKSNQSFISARDKYFIKPRPAGDLVNQGDNEALSEFFDEMGRAVSHSTALAQDTVGSMR